MMIARTVREMTAAGAAGIHLEDQVQAKRCGHRPGKALVPAAEMVDRVRAAVDARTDPAFVIMARTDAYSVEGLAGADRARRAVRGGRGGHDLRRGDEQPRRLPRVHAASARVPVLANLTEFGKTPLFTLEECAAAGVRLVLYPLSAFRAMSAAALAVYETIRREGTQEAVARRMQTRAELYDGAGVPGVREEAGRAVDQGGRR